MVESSLQGAQSEKSESQNHFCMLYILNLVGKKLQIILSRESICTEYSVTHSGNV